MEKCRLKVLSDSYSGELPLSSKSSSIGPSIAIMPTIGRKSAKINAIWRLNYCNFNYMIMFYLLFKNKAFEIDLIVYSGTLETKVCKFVPETFSASLSNNTWTISAILEVIQ